MIFCQGDRSNARGEIEVDSTVGVGTEFRVYLPIGGADINDNEVEA